MKKLLSLLMCGLLLFGCGDKYDDSALRNDLNDLENRVAKLEELCKQMNTNISSLQKIVEALQDNLSISKVEQISDGYIIHFSDGSTATIKNGKNSEDAPIIGVKKDTDGIYYWTLDGEWLTDEKGNKVKAQGTDGKDGVDGEDGTNGKDGITPQLKIENGRWMLSMDNGKTWTDIGQATGADGTDGEDGVDGKDGTNGIFKSVTEDNDNVYFTLEDDSVITIPKSDNSKFAIAFDTTDIAILNGGESKTISYTITDATKNTVVKAIAQDVWKLSVLFKKFTVKIIHNSAVISCIHLIQRKSIEIFKLYCRFRRYLSKIKLAALKLHCAYIVVRHYFKYNFVYFRRAEIKIIKFLQRYALSEIPLRKLVRSCTNWIPVKIVSRHILAGEQVFRKDAHSQIIEHRHIRSCQLYSYMRIINYRN